MIRWARHTRGGETGLKVHRHPDELCAAGEVNRGATSPASANGPTIKDEATRGLPLLAVPRVTLRLDLDLNSGARN